MSDVSPAVAPVAGDIVRQVRFTQGVVEGVRLFAESLGFVAVRIDLAGCADKQCCLGRVAEALAFPDWFGANWDALADCLGDLGWRPARGYVLLVEHADELRRSVPDEFATLLDVFAEAGATWQSRGVAFRVFVDAD